MSEEMCVKDETLPASFCADCRGNSHNARQVTLDESAVVEEWSTEPERMYRFQARYAGQCHGCPRRIDPDDRVWGHDRRVGYLCDPCGQRARAEMPT